MRRPFRRAVRATINLVAGLIVAFAVAYAGVIAAGYKPVAVYSGSMRPTLGVGSLAFVRPVDSSKVRVGDVITFRDPYVQSRLVTHRVRQILRTRQGQVFRTKGDANPTRDPWTIRLNGKVGRLSFQVPFAGYALVYAHTREARSALILLAAVLVLLGLLGWIWRRPEPAASTQ
jgi:signal peptidase